MTSNSSDFDIPLFWYFSINLDTHTLIRIWTLSHYVLFAKKTKQIFWRIISRHELLSRFCMVARSLLDDWKWLLTGPSQKSPSLSLDMAQVHFQSMFIGFFQLFYHLPFWMLRKVIKHSSSISYTILNFIHSCSTNSAGWVTVTS